MYLFCMGLSRFEVSSPIALMLIHDAALVDEIDALVGEFDERRGVELEKLRLAETSPRSRQSSGAAGRSALSRRRSTPRASQADGDVHERPASSWVIVNASWPRLLPGLVPTSIRFTRYPGSPAIGTPSGSSSFGTTAVCIIRTTGPGPCFRRTRPRGAVSVVQVGPRSGCPAVPRRPATRRRRHRGRSVPARAMPCRRRTRRTRPGRSPRGPSAACSEAGRLCSPSRTGVVAGGRWPAS